MISDLIALIAATLFAGAALYITLVEHPVRMCLGDAAQLTQWQPSYKRALPIQAGLALVGGAAGLAAWWFHREWPWVAGSVFLLSNWPFTMLVIMPTNKRLMATTPQHAGAESRRLLRRWGNLHGVRSALGSAAAFLFAWAFLITN